VTDAVRDLLQCEGVASSGTTLNALAYLQEDFAVTLPQDYIEFMLESDGFEGSIGKSEYIVIWPLYYIVPGNKVGYNGQFIEGLVYFGSNGGGEGYAFDARDGRMSVIMRPWIGLAFEDAVPCGNTFSEFIERLIIDQSCL
jgi:hypothetical protein